MKEDITIKIKHVPKHMYDSRLVKPGDVFKVLTIARNKRQELFYLFESENGKLSLAYDDEVKVIIGHKN